MADPASPPACPRCGASTVVRAENEGDHRSHATLPLILAAAFLVLGAYFAFVVYAYLAYPLTIMLFSAAAAWVMGRREKTKRRRPRPATRYYCNNCDNYFASAAGGSPGDSVSRSEDTPSTTS